MHLRRTEVETPVGPLSLVSKAERLVGLCFGDRWRGLQRHLERRFGEVSITPAGADAATRWLADYFAGRLEALGDIPVDPGGSQFQREVWAALREIPVGRTASYTEIAERLGRPTGARAVATANALNPVAIVIPCHRVIHADGSLSGYGGGVPRKRWLLRHEGAILL